MAIKPIPQKEEKAKLVKILPGTPEMEVFLQSGYPDMTEEKAETIIRERKENPALWPYAMLERAQNFLAALKATPRAVDTTPHWVRDKAR